MKEILRLKKPNCKNCYKCIRHCPVKAIRFTAGQANVIENECILCGQCYDNCPQNAKEIVSQMEKVRVMLSTGEVYASVAPSFAAEFPGVGIDALEDALKQLGFAGAEETAIGAKIVKTEYERILREEKPDVLLSSCCSSVNLLMRKHYPDTLYALAPVVTPMQAHCAELRRKHPDAKVVFIGPCIAKKEEAAETGCADAVLSFEEVIDWMLEKGVQLRPRPDERAGGKTRLFPTAGGILDTMEKLPEYTYLAIDGLDKCKAVLEEIRASKLHRCFIEMSACPGSCIGGPLMGDFRMSLAQNTAQIIQYAAEKDFIVPQPGKAECHQSYPPIQLDAGQPSEKEIQDMLVRMGKTDPAMRLNCGSCGYNSCREKAIAVIQGKAEMSMCLPYMMEKAEGLSDAVVVNSPNGILVLNDELEIQKINPVACRMLLVRDERDVLGEQVIRLMDPNLFRKVRDKGRPLKEEHIYLAEYDRYVDRIILYKKDLRLFICTMRDVTADVLDQEKKMETRQQAVEMADDVARRQLKIVQDIAFLLGETAADTLTAIERLKETISDE